MSRNTLSWRGAGRAGSAIRGWAPKGECLIGRAPHGHWRTMTFIAALRHDRIDAPFVLDGPVNSEAFRADVEHLPAPILRPGDVVVMGNLGSHKGKPVRDVIRAARAHLLFLPPYSPDLTPSNRCLQSSSTCCTPPANEPWRPHGAGSGHSSTASHPGNAQTTSSMLDTLQSNLITR